MIPNPYKKSKNEIHEFIRQVEINHQYFEKIRVEIMKSVSFQPKNIQERICQFLTSKPFINGISYLMIGLLISYFFNIPIVLTLLSMSTYILLTLCFSMCMNLILSDLPHSFNEFHLTILYLTHLGLDSTVILQRICNQNSQFANFLRNYHQFEEILKLHQVDLQELLNQIKKDTTYICSENIMEKLNILKKLNQDIQQSLLFLEDIKTIKNSDLSSSLIQKSIFAINNHQKLCISHPCLTHR